MKKLTAILCTLLMLLTAAGSAAELPEAAQPLLPPDAALLSDYEAGPFRVLTLELPTGEQLEYMLNARTGEPLSLITLTAAPAAESAEISRELLETVLLAAYPDARILSSSKDEAGFRSLSVLGENYCGTVLMAGESIVSRSLTCGAYADGGRLTMDGALAALSILRPGAEFRALELDEDDGLLLYEGDALLDGDKYEFELDAHTGRLLEWERD